MFNTETKLIALGVEASVAAKLVVAGLDTPKKIKVGVSSAISKKEISLTRDEQTALLQRFDVQAEKKSTALAPSIDATVGEDEILSKMIIKEEATKSLEEPKAVAKKKTVAKRKAGK